MRRSRPVMWLRVLCVLVVAEAAVARRIYDGEKSVQEAAENRTSAVEQDLQGSGTPTASALVQIADQDGSGSALVTRRLPAGSEGLQHSFGVKIEHPYGGDHHGRVLEQKQYHTLGESPVDQERNQEIEPSQTTHGSVGGGWKGIERFKDQDQHNTGYELNQHQMLGQVLQGLGQVNQVLGQNHQGMHQVNQIFGGLQDHREYNGLSYGDRAVFHGGQKQEDLQNFVNTHQEGNFGTFEGVNNNLIETKDTNHYNFRNEHKPILNSNLCESDDSKNYNFGNEYNPVPHIKVEHPPKPSESVTVKTEGVKTTTITKEVPVPYTVEIEKKIPFKVEIPVEKPYPVEVRKPYPVFVEKRVPYTVKQFVPQPYTVYTRVPYPVKVHVRKPYPVHVPKPYRVLVEKKVPYQVEKRVPYPVRVYVDKPYPVHVPVVRTVPYTVEKKVPMPVQVTVATPYAVPVPRPYRVYVQSPEPLPERETTYHPHPQALEQFRPQEVDQGAHVEHLWQMEPMQHSERGQHPQGEGWGQQAAPDQGYHPHSQWMEPMQHSEHGQHPQGEGWGQQAAPGQGYHPHSQWMEPMHHSWNHPGTYRQQEVTVDQGWRRDQPRPQWREPTQHHGQPQGTPGHRHPQTSDHPGQNPQGFHSLHRAQAQHYS